MDLKYIYIFRFVITFRTAVKYVNLHFRFNSWLWFEKCLWPWVILNCMTLEAWFFFWSVNAFWAAQKIERVNASYCPRIIDFIHHLKMKRINAINIEYKTSIALMQHLYPSLKYFCISTIFVLILYLTEERLVLLLSATMMGWVWVDLDLFTT